MKYSTIIFDLDGTLLNTLDDLAASVNFAMRKCGYPERTTDEVRRFVGNGIALLIRRAVPANTSEEKFDEALGVFKAHYAKNNRNKTAPYEGITELLAVLKKQGCKTAIVSNKVDFAVKDLKSEFFEGLIDTAVGESEDTRTKPAPDMVYKVLDMLGETAENAVYIGDTDVDIKTAENSGMDCIRVTWGFRKSEELECEDAAMLAYSPEDVLKFISI